jgi:hypothetical protein
MDKKITGLQLEWRKLRDKQTHRSFAKRAYGIRQKLAWLPWNPQQVFEESGPVIRHIQRVRSPFPVTIWPTADPFGCILYEEVEGVGTTTATAGDTVALLLQVCCQPLPRNPCQQCPSSDFLHCPRGFLPSGRNFGHPACEPHG